MAKRSEQRAGKCETCGAYPGHPCKTITGKPLYVSHLARYLPAGSFREHRVVKPYRARRPGASGG